MNLINKILLLLILIVLIYHLTDGKIINKIRNYLFICKDKVKKIIDETPKKIGVHNSDHTITNTDSLTNFINTRVNTNYNIERTNSPNVIVANANVQSSILNSINKIFNYREFKFINIKLLENISYRLHKQGKELLPFNFSADVLHYNQPIAHVVINIECFLREDLANYNNDNILLEISKIKLVEKNNKIEIKSIELDYEPVVNNTISKIEQDAINENKKLTDKMTDSFNNHFVSRDSFDDLFIKPDSQIDFTGFCNDTENSLIPSIIELSAYERTSETQTSNI